MIEQSTSMRYVLLLLIALAAASPAAEAATPDLPHLQLHLRGSGGDAPPLTFGELTMTALAVNSFLLAGSEFAVFKWRQHSFPENLNSKNGAPLILAGAVGVLVLPFLSAALVDKLTHGQTSISRTLVGGGVEMSALFLTVVALVPFASANLVPLLILGTGLVVVTSSLAEAGMILAMDRAAHDPRNQMRRMFQVDTREEPMPLPADAVRPALPSSGVSVPLLALQL